MAKRFFGAVKVRQNLNAFLFKKWKHLQYKITVIP
jgi:hypothetical protein